MYRKIMDYLKEWKHSEHRKPLIPWGYPVCFKSVCVSSKENAALKHIELEYDINFWQDNKIVFVGK